MAKTQIDADLIMKVEELVSEVMRSWTREYPQYAICVNVIIADETERDAADPSDFGAGHRITAYGGNRNAANDLVVVQGLNHAISKITE